MNEAAVRESFRVQAGFCERLGSPFTAALLRLTADRLDRTGETGRRVLGWTGDPDGSADALALRLAGGLHALARDGRCPPLSEAYAALDHARLPDALNAAPGGHDGFRLPWLESPPQTNEVARSAVLMAGLLALAAERAGPVELFELGSSAGLNLNLGLYAYELGGVAAGEAGSALLLRPKWEGSAPPAANVRVVQASGVDIAPVDLSDPVARARLPAYVWPDQRERLNRLERALEIAAAHPPRVVRGHADAWLAERLAEPQAAGTVRVVMHSVVLQYLSPAERARVEALLGQAGERATPERPLARVGMETEAFGQPMALRLTTWPGERARVLAEVHAHGSAVRWLGA